MKVLVEDFKRYAVRFDAVNGNYLQCFGMKSLYALFVKETVMRLVIVLTLLFDYLGIEIIPLD